MRASTVLVTGASAGIGRATAVAFAERGATVLAVARSADALAGLAAEHPSIRPLPADLARREERTRLVEEAGPIDVLVNNAGVGLTGLVEDVPRDEIARIVEVNLVAVMDLSRLVLPAMLERRSGHIVNVGSVLGWVAAPPLTVYSATKFGVQGFTDGLRREVEGRGVEVTLIHPGAIDTRFLRRASEEELGSDLPARLAGLPPSAVASAIVRAVERPWRPGYRSVSVPRIAGVARLAVVPPVAVAIDVVSRLTRSLAPRSPQT